MEASSLDNAFLRKVRESHPTPIAQVARRFQAASEDGRRLAEAKNLIHALILTLGTISLAWCQYRELRPDGVQHWYDKFQRSAPTLGDWLGAARAGARLASEIGVPLSGLEAAVGRNGNSHLAELDMLVKLRNRDAHSTTGGIQTLPAIERHLRAALDVCEFLEHTEFVIVEGNEPLRSGGFRITVRAIVGDNPIFLPAPALHYPQALYSETLYLLQEPGDHLEIAPFWVAREAKGENGWELFYLNKRVDRGRGFEYVNFFKPDDSFVDHELPQAFSWFGDRRRSAKRFKRAHTPESLSSGRTVLPADRIDLAGLQRQTMRSLLLAMSVDQANGNRGWNHHLGLPPIFPVGTAFGLRIMQLVDSSPSLFQSDEILETLWRHRTSDGCWRSRSQQPTGRPEATASVLLALADQKDWKRARAVQAPFERLLEPGRDPALWTYTWSMALALPALSTIAPDSGLLEVLARALEDAAVRDSRGRILYWTRFSRHAGHDADPSPAHTARVLLAMQHCRKATDRRLGTPPDELETALHWLLGQPRWDNLYEEIRRPTGARGEILTNRHFTSAWVVRALLEYGIDPMHRRIRSTVADLYRSHDEGLWDWVAPDGSRRVRRPGWATLDALRALNAYVLRGSQC